MCITALEHSRGCSCECFICSMLLELHVLHAHVLRAFNTRSGPSNRSSRVVANLQAACFSSAATSEASSQAGAQGCRHDEPDHVFRGAQRSKTEI